MRMCKPHWEDCKKAIEDRGMGHLCTKTGEELMTDAVAEMQGEQLDPKEAFDPLMGLNNQLFCYTLERAGLWLLSKREPDDGMPENDGEYCPLCLIKRDFDKHNTPTGRCENPNCHVRVNAGELSWEVQTLSDAAGFVRRYAEQIGVVSKPS